MYCHRLLVLVVAVGLVGFLGGFDCLTEARSCGDTGVCQGECPVPLPDPGVCPHCTPRPPCGRATCVEGSLSSGGGAARSASYSVEGSVSAAVVDSPAGSVPRSAGYVVEPGAL